MTLSNDQFNQPNLLKLMRKIENYKKVKCNSYLPLRRSRDKASAKKRFSCYLTMVPPVFNGVLRSL